MTVRIASPADIETIMSIEQAAPEAPHWKIAQYHDLFSSQESNVERKLFVWDAGERLEGFVVVSRLGIADSPAGDIENVVVRPSARRRGIGLALCRSAIFWLEEHAVREIDLEVRASSQGPIRLYEKLGFIQVGVRKSYYRDPLEDAILMRRRRP